MQRLQAASLYCAKCFLPGKLAGVDIARLALLRSPWIKNAASLSVIKNVLQPGFERRER